MNLLVCYTDGQSQVYKNNSTCYKDEEIDPQALDALDGLNELLNKSELQVTEEIQRTNEMAQLALQQMKGQFAALLEENRKLREQLIQAESQQSQLKTIHQSEIAAWKEKSELAEKSNEFLRQEIANSEKRSEAEKKALIQDKEKAVKIAVETGDARVDAIRQQINANLGPVYLKDGHWVNKIHLRAMSRGSGPYCTCHKKTCDPKNFNSLKGKEWPTKEALAEAILKQIETFEKISS